MAGQAPEASLACRPQRLLLRAGPHQWRTCAGGTNWFSSSWSPITKFFYVRATEWCAVYKKQEDPLVENRWYGGVAPNQPGGQNFIRALKSDNGQKAWEFPLTTFGRGGVLSTAGG